MTAPSLFRRLARAFQRIFTLPTFSQGYLFDTLIAEQRIPPAGLPGLQVRELRLDDETAVLELERIYGIPMTAARIRRRLQEGKRCFTAWSGEHLVSYVWFRLDVMHVRDLYFDQPIGPQDVYVFDAHTLPEFRGKSIYPYLTGTAVKQIGAETGRTRALYLVRVENQASLRAARSMGFRPIVHRRVLTLFGRHFPIERPLSPKKIWPPART